MASLIVSDSAPPSMQSMPLKEDGRFLKFFETKNHFPNYHGIPSAESKKILKYSRALGTTNYLKAFVIGNYD